MKGDDGSKLSINVPSSGRVPNGASVEREVPNDFAGQAFVVLNLHDPDFTTAARLAGGLNELLGPGTAQALDAVSVKVSAPLDPNQRIAYLSTLESVEWACAPQPRIGFPYWHIVIGSRVRVTKVPWPGRAVGTIPTLDEAPGRLARCTGEPRSEIS